ncbi:family 43 glycosylhydrolase [Hymenobacter sp. HDW8]|uniref:family 43 glycosylhydrolase n=1 Tax=Hymenobacter sp. HDW8 TaxID=2714932 RepID=UPI00140AE4CB|nr:glycosyl hydrolase 43 family protein [Hymenobacter sp. HDW8]
MTTLLSSFSKKAGWLATLGLSVVIGCQPPATATQPADNPTATAVTPEPAAPATPTAPPIPNPVLPGDFPDPSVTKVGTNYWATATSSNWGPVFPLLKSDNLTDWKIVGHVFPEMPPAGPTTTFGPRNQSGQWQNLCVLLCP